jgi:hypothetical protein
MMECQKEEGEGNPGTVQHRETALILPDADRLPVCMASVAETRNKRPSRFRIFARACSKLRVGEINNYLKSIAYCVSAGWHRECIDMLQVLQGMGGIAVPRLSC